MLPQMALACRRSGSRRVFLVVETVVMYLLNRTTPGNACGIFYLLGNIGGVGPVAGRAGGNEPRMASALAFTYLCSWPAAFMWATIHGTSNGPQKIDRGQVAATS